MTTAYIAGPMTGLPDYNYPAFHEAARLLREAHPDWTVINPAENFGGDQSLPWDHYLRHAIQQVASADMICLLPGWSKSKGALLEYGVAHGLDLPVAYLMGAEHAARSMPAPSSWSDWFEPDGAKPMPERIVGKGGATAWRLSDPEPMPEVRRYIRTFTPQEGVRPTATVEQLDVVTESIAQEAHRVVMGPRQQDYGHPLDNFTHTGRLWAPILGLDEVTAEQVALCMVAVKISRECHRPKRDNRVDGAGYFQTLDLIAERRRP